MMNCFTTDYGWKLLGGKGGGKGAKYRCTFDLLGV